MKIFEPRWFERWVKEAVFIRAAKPPVNEDGEKFLLPAVVEHHEEESKAARARDTVNLENFASY